ncbi:MAG: ABC transporter, fused permease protein [uncultured Chloroflexia bacterium]|uniref:ABC transporter, fused permease protein n=1 Tax=uncultured Chloroflexia bacterium TaxID=1672391 RepID=A0A6J4JRL2_9CHLR|nr:MAG: ABC transporter, fused permease protein [uncultured Chloroflexia bacterium]
MTPLVLRSSLRYLVRHPWQLALSILGIALGVAVVVAIDVANGSARRAFTLSAETVTGRATYQIVGSSNGIDETLYTRLVDDGLEAKAPIVEGFLTIGAGAGGAGGRPLRLLGIDPFAEAPFRGFTSGGSTTTTPGFESLLTRPASMILSGQTAESYGVGVGETLQAQVGGKQVGMAVVGLIEPTDDASRRALDGLAIADIATAQEVLGMIGRLSRIDLIADEPAVERLKSLLPPDVDIVTPAARSATITQLTSAFETNLTALSLLALVVGMFLIYNTITFSVVQRRALFGTLRCLGVTRRQIFGLIMLEALGVGLVGAVAGIALGLLLGRGLVGLVTQTINDLYFAVSVREVFVAPLTLLKGLVLGVGATIFAAALPAREATLAQPRAVLRRSSIEDVVRVAVPRLLLAGVALFGVGGGLLLLPTRSLVVSFIALFCFVVGSSFLTPAITVGFMRIARPVLGRSFGLLGRMAARDVIAALSRTSVAIAALMVAVSVTVGVGIMVSSFRETVVTWLDASLAADIYVSPPGFSVTRSDVTIDPQAVAAIKATPGIAATSGYRGIMTGSQYGQTQLLGLDLAAEGESSYQFVNGDPTQIWRAWRAGGMIVSEPFAYRHDVTTGTSITIRTPQGDQTTMVVGIVYDYASEQGGVVVPMTLFRQWYGDLPLSSLAAYVAPGEDVDKTVRAAQEQVSPIQELDVRSNVGLRTATLEIFDRTFAITGVLQLLATVIAFVGILSALMALQLERARELGVMRANGLTPRQLWGVVLGQTGLMGLTAGLLSLPVGVMVATVLVYIINRRSFGWTLRFVIPPTILLQAAVLALVAALLAGLYPAYRMGRTSPALALREE